MILDKLEENITIDMTRTTHLQKQNSDMFQHIGFPMSLRWGDRR
jgi:hypothetical protein